jgi:SHS family lactate transporter-like MFS transporter
VLVYFATTYNLGFAIPMLVSTVITVASVIISLLLSPETKGRVLVSDLVVA